MSSMRLLHCSETIKGGTATYLRELLPLQAAEFGPEALVVVIPASQVQDLPLPAGVRCVPFADSGGRAGNALTLARTTLQVAKEFRPTVVHAHGTFAGAAVRPAMALLHRRARLVYCAHGWAWDRPMSTNARHITVAIERLLARMTDAIVCISDHEKHSAVRVGLPTDKLHVVRNGVAAQAPASEGPAPQWPDGTPKLLFVGRFDRQKGVDLLIDALSRPGTKASAILVGGSVLGDTQALQLPSNVRAAGWLSPSRIEAHFAEADLLVMPSRWEGFGLVAAEAMRAGLPVLATRVGGLPEIIMDKETGMLVPPNDANALCDAISRFDPNQGRKKMGQAAMQRVQAHFTMRRVHDELHAIYHDELRAAHGSI